MIEEQRETSIVPATAIVRSCHLIPRYGREKNVYWNSENVLDRCEEFLFNSHFDFHTFASLNHE